MSFEYHTTDDGTALFTLDDDGRCQQAAATAKRRDGRTFTHFRDGATVWLDTYDERSAWAASTLADLRDD